MLHSDLIFRVANCIEVPVAQRLARRTMDREMRGSNPAGHRKSFVKRAIGWALSSKPSTVPRKCSILLPCLFMLHFPISKAYNRLLQAKIAWIKNPNSALNYSWHLFAIFLQETQDVCARFVRLVRKLQDLARCVNPNNRELCRFQTRGRRQWRAQKRMRLKFCTIWSLESFWRYLPFSLNSCPYFFFFYSSLTKVSVLNEVHQF